MTNLKFQDTFGKPACFMVPAPKGDTSHPSMHPVLSGFSPDSLQELSLNPKPEGNEAFEPLNKPNTLNKPGSPQSLRSRR